MIFEIIMAVCFYPVLFILYFVMKNSSNYSDGLMFGCRLQYEYSKTTEIAEVQKSFAKQMNIFLLAAVVLPVTTFFIKHMSIQLTIWMAWLIVVIIFCNVPYIVAHEKVINLKREKGWSIESSNTIITDTKLPGRIRTVKFTDFIIPVVVSAVSCVYAFINLKNVIYGAVYVYSISLSFVFATVMFLIAAYVIDRQQCKVISRNSDINMNYNRASKKLWRDLWIILSYINAVVTAVICFSMKSSNNSVIMIMVSIIEIIVLVIVSLSVMKKKDNLYKSYAEYMEIDLQKDDDANWIGGMFYYNPNDKHVSVDKRVGIGTTVNMASGLGKFLSAFSILAILSLIPICGFLIRDEFTPINLHVENNVLICSHTSEKYKLNVNKITEVKEIDKLPSLSRTNGTGMDTLLKGNFSSKDYGKCNVLLNPQNAKFIELKYDGKTYFLSSKDDKSTEEVYNEIK